jgi:hypothetical protein
VTARLRVATGRLLEPSYESSPWTLPKEGPASQTKIAFAEVAQPGARTSASGSQGSVPCAPPLPSKDPPELDCPPEWLVCPPAAALVPAPLPQPAPNNANPTNVPTQPPRQPKANLTCDPSSYRRGAQSVNGAREGAPLQSRFADPCRRRLGRPSPRSVTIKTNFSGSEYAPRAPKIDSLPRAFDERARGHVSVARVSTRRLALPPRRSGRF